MRFFYFMKCKTLIIRKAISFNCLIMLWLLFFLKSEFLYYLCQKRINPILTANIGNRQIIAG